MTEQSHKRGLAHTAAPAGYTRRSRIAPECLRFQILLKVQYSISCAPQSLIFLWKVNDLCSPQ